MLSEHRIIALCADLSHETNYAPLINSLHRAALRDGRRLMVFASFSETTAVQNTANVYDLVNFNVVDSLIVIRQGRRNDTKLHEVCARAVHAGKPFLVLGDAGNWKNGVSLEWDHETAFRGLLEHLVVSHGVKDSVLICGDRTDDTHSETCAHIYRGVLAEHGLDCMSQNMYYCEYRDSNVYAIVQNISKRRKLPDAIVCVNDHIAQTVVRALSGYGFSVPRDVIVTGIEENPEGEFFQPSISSCHADADELAGVCLAALKDAALDPAARRVIRYKSVTHIANSCCQKETDAHSVTELSRIITGMIRHEDHMFSWMDEISGINDPDSLYSALSQLISSHSVLCLNRNVTNLLSGGEDCVSSGVKEDYTVIYAARSNSGRELRSLQPMDNIIPDAQEWAQKDKLCLITLVSTRDMVCGRYAVMLDELKEDKYKIRRVSKTINTVMNVALNRFSTTKLINSIEASAYTNSITGLPNLKGATRWFEALSENEDNHRFHILFTVYCLPKYNFIYENYGMYETEEAVRFVAQQLKKTHGSGNGMLAQIAQDEFLSVNTFENEAEIGPVTEKIQKQITEAMNSFNLQSRKDFIVEIDMGSTRANAGWNGSMENFVKLAYGEMYKNRMLRSSHQEAQTLRSSAQAYAAFNYLVDNNLFTYNFQPIIDAKTGSVFGYEALMRTSGGVNMSPLEILETAREYQRLYDIEKITLFNIVERYSREFDSFRGRKLFINTIPGSFLNEKDRAELTEKYRALLDHFVFEITQQDTVSDEELGNIKKISRDGIHGQVAIDDYGTGHSNIANLLRYAPQIIKVDRFLINDIQNDTNKQMFLKNTVEFARMNKIMVLAEGVECFEEMQTAIECGVDLIQGFYTARPAPYPLNALSAKLKNEIIAENLRLSKYDNDMMEYTAAPGETINIIDLAYKKYTYVNVREGQVTFTGEKDNTVDLVIRVAEQSEATLVFDNVNIKGAVETTVQIGTGTRCTVILKGENTLNKEGIHVPESASLYLRGDGNLTVNNNRNYSVGIGSNFSDAHGEIDIDIRGELRIFSSGDKVVSIGGGRGRSTQVVLNGGDIHVKAKGINVLGIGSADDCAMIRIGKANIDVQCSGDNAVSIGSVRGTVDIESFGNISVVADGEKSVGIGTFAGPDGRVKLLSGTVNAVAHCDIGACIGSVSGRVSVENIGADTDTYCEGTSARCLGSVNGNCTVRISGGRVKAHLLAAENMPFGNKNDTLTIVGGSVLCPDAPVHAQNDYGQTLKEYHPEGETFEKLVIAGEGSYYYTATCRHRDEMLCVYLPDEE